MDLGDAAFGTGAGVVGVDGSVAGANGTAGIVGESFVDELVLAGSAELEPLPEDDSALAAGTGGGGGRSGIDGREPTGLASAPVEPEPGAGRIGKLKLSVPSGGSVTLDGEYA